MSNYEHHVGKIKLVDENFTKEKLEKILSEDDIDEENTLEELEGRETYSIYNNNYDVKYIVHKDKLFQITEHKEFRDDIYIQSLSDSGEFTMLFYNGGTCFSEMLEESIKKKCVCNQYVHSSPIVRDVSKIEIIELTNKYREECMRIDLKKMAQ